MGSLSPHVMVLQIERQGEPDVFDDVPGVRVARVQYRFESEAIENIANQWLHMNAGQGMGQLMLDVQGIANDSPQFTQMLEQVFQATLQRYRLMLDDDRAVVGAFQVQSYGQYTRYETEIGFTMRLASAGEIELLTIV